MLDTYSKVGLLEMLGVELAEVVAVVTWVELKGESLRGLGCTWDKEYRGYKVRRGAYADMGTFCGSDTFAFEELFKVQHFKRLFARVKEDNIIFQVALFVGTTLYGIEMSVLGVAIFGEH